jgi:hypothetical protein
MLSRARGDTQQLHSQVLNGQPLTPASLQKSDTNPPTTQDPGLMSSEPEWQTPLFLSQPFMMEFLHPI